MKDKKQNKKIEIDYVRSSDYREEHDEIMIEIGHPPEGDGQEHAEIMREILGH